MNTKTILFALSALTGSILSAQHNGDGPRKGPPPAEEIAVIWIEHFDSNADGVLSLEEFEIAAAEHHKHLLEGPKGRNRDGNSSQSERPRSPAKTDAANCQTETEEHLTEIFTAADADSSHSLNEIELASALESMRPPRPDRKRN